MSFRKRLTTFFVLIVVLPMIAVGALVFRLISDSQQGKTDARASGLASSVASVYLQQADAARADARTIARQLSTAPANTVVTRLTVLLPQAGLARVVVTLGGHRVADVGDGTAIAPGTARVRSRRRPDLTVSASALTAADYVAGFARAAGTEVVVTRGSHVVAATLHAPRRLSLPVRGTVQLGGVAYRVITQLLPDFNGTRLAVTVLSDPRATGGSTTGSRLVALMIIIGFLLLAVAFALLSSRALQGQLLRFLQATRRLGSADFSSPVPIEGGDEFAALGVEFNNMSRQLDERLQALTAAQARLRDAVTRIGDAFAHNLDRQGLARLALHTAIDAAQADSGRISIRSEASGALTEAAREGELHGLQEPVLEAEREAMHRDEIVEPATDGERDHHVLAASLGRIEGSDRSRGVITVVRRGEPFSDEDRALLRTLAAQSALALENVDLHFQVSRQAVTDELTGLANHGRFQDRLSAEFDGVRRYGYPVALIMVDIDNFKSVNDTYGHQQGDRVLREVARVLQDSSRETDTPARYGGEEMALILPHTEIEGAFAIAERVRQTIAALRVRRLDGGEPLQITASLGVCLPHRRRQGRADRRSRRGPVPRQAGGQEPDPARALNGCERGRRRVRFGRPWVCWTTRSASTSISSAVAVPIRGRSSVPSARPSAPYDGVQSR